MNNVKKLTEEVEGIPRRELLASIATDIKWMKEVQLEKLSAIQEHLRILNNSVAKNTKRGIENRSYIQIHWKLLIAMVSIGGAALIILLERILSR